MSIRINLCVFLSSITVIVLGASPAVAAPGNETGQVAEDRIEEVIVTAQKRQQNLQSVPIAITAFNAAELGAARIDSFEEIASRTPGFVVGGNGPHSPELTVRGIGSTDREAGSDRSVVMFVDEVYIGRTGGSSIDLFDLERVEVLRGPQGTLFGKNVVGGLINVITAKPTSEPFANFRASLGDYQYFEAQGAVNQPLSDNLLSRVSFSVKNRDGTSFNRQTGNKMDGYDKANIRAQLKYPSSDDFTYLIAGEYSHDKVHGISSRPGPLGGFGLVSLDFTDQDPDPLVVDNNIDGLLDRTIWGISGRGDWETSLGTFTSLTSLRSVKFHMDRDAVGVPLTGGAPGENLGFFAQSLEYETDLLFSQELRLTSDTGADDRLNWVTGLYFMSEDTSRDQQPGGIFALAGRPPRISDPLFKQDNKTTSYAVFGEATYQLTDELSLTAGGRYLVDKKKWTLETIDNDPENTNSIAPAVELFSIGNNDSWNAFTPKVSINYKVNDNNLLYGLVSRGFKSGGRGGNAGTIAAAQKRFEPEWAWNYELGTKSRFLEDRLQLNLAGFLMKFKDLQSREIIELVPGDPTTRVAVIYNSSKAEIYGIEAELLAVPVRGLTLSATYAYLHSEITDSVNPTYTGTILPRAPKDSYSIMGEYKFPVGDKGYLSVRADYRYQGLVYYDLGEVAAGREPGRGVLDARIAFDAAEGGWGISLWARNIFDERYRVQAQSCCGGVFATGRYGDPVTYGVSLDWFFD